MVPSGRRQVMPEIRQIFIGRGKGVKNADALERKLRIANALIALQKKAHELLGLALPEPPEDES